MPLDIVSTTRLYKLPLRRFARNRTASSYVLGAEGSGTVVAVGEGVHQLKAHPLTRKY